MKIMLVTDIEGVSGVLNFAEWCIPQGRYYEKGKFRKRENQPDAPDVLYQKHDTSFIGALNAPYTAE